MTKSSRSKPSVARVFAPDKDAQEAALRRLIERAVSSGASDKPKRAEKRQQTARR